MFDSYINYNELKKSIIKFDSNNKKIVDAMSIIHKTMMQIDDKDWHSPEKERINNNFIPFLKEQVLITNNRLDANTKILKEALVLYEQNENNMIEETENLEEL